MLVCVMQELVRLHGGTLSVTSIATSETSPEQPHGSTFVVSIPLGSKHLAPSLIDVQLSDETPRNSYGRSVVEEAARWHEEGLVSDDSSTGTLDRSEAGSSDGFPRPLVFEPSALFFKKSDVVLIGEN